MNQIFFKMKNQDFINWKSRILKICNYKFQNKERKIKKMRWRIKKFWLTNNISKEKRKLKNSYNFIGK